MPDMETMESILAAEEETAASSLRLVSDAADAGRVGVLAAVAKTVGEVELAAREVMPVMSVTPVVAVMPSIPVISMVEDSDWINA